jgi:serine/threonine protein phosphatase PrpC
MSSIERQASRPEILQPRKPRDDELDVFGLTHPGKVRESNEDQFILASLQRRLEVHASSLPADSLAGAVNSRVAFLAMVADGVGGRAKGEEASRLALEESTLYLTQSVRCWYRHDDQESEFMDLLQAAAIRSHQRVLERASADEELSGMASTLTLWLGVWPWSYLLQVGDSRYYLYREGTLTQISRDQTIAQELVDRGVLARSALERSPLANVLSSAIGGAAAAPVVTRIAADWSNVHLLCSDGLTKHVSDERIAERLRDMTSARQCCEALLQDALDAGGSDNVTIMVGRSIRKDPG